LHYRRLYYYKRKDRRGWVRGHLGKSPYEEEEGVF
jgi:hypothetical protein